MGRPTRQNSSSNPSESSDQEMNIFLKVSQTLSLKVKKSTTIKHLKSMIREKEGVSEYFQELYFSGEQLKDECKLVDCGIQKNSTVHLVLQTMDVVKLFINIPSKKKTFELQARVHDTIQKVKSLIQLTEGISADTCILYHTGILLEDFKTLGSFGITGESTLHLVFVPKDVLSVTVKLKTGKVVRTEVRFLYTVGDVKAIVGGIAGVPVDKLRLIYTGKELDDSKTLASYNIADKSLLEMLPVDIDIFVRHQSDESIVVEVCQQDTVTEAKSKIFRKLRIFLDSDFHYLTYAGQRLENGRDLASYGIAEKCTLYVRTQDISLGVITPSRKKVIKFEVTVDDTLEKIKTLIQVREGIESDQYDYYYRGVILDENRTLASFNIKKGSLIEVKLRSACMRSPPIQILVKPWTGKTITLYVCQHETVGDVKGRIFSKLAIPNRSFYYLMFSGKRLDDDHQLASYGIKKDSTLHVICIATAE